MVQHLDACSTEVPVNHLWRLRCYHFVQRCANSQPALQMNYADYEDCDIASFKIVKRGDLGEYSADIGSDLMRQ